MTHYTWRIPFLFFSSRTPYGELWEGDVRYDNPSYDATTENIDIRLENTFDNQTYETIQDNTPGY